MSIRLSEAAGQAVGKLQRGLRVGQRPPLLRLALAVGLRDSHGDVPAQADSRGPEVPLKVIIAGYEELYDSLLVELLAIHAPVPASERRRVIKCLVDYGLGLMDASIKECGSAPEYLIRLARASHS